MMFIMFLPNICISGTSDPYSSIMHLGEIARNAIPKEKPGRLRAYLLPVGQKKKQSIKDLTEALSLEKGRSGYFALLSYDQEKLVSTILAVLPTIENRCFCKLSVIYVGSKRHKDLISNAFLHTGATFIFKEYR